MHGQLRSRRGPITCGATGLYILGIHSRGTVLLVAEAGLFAAVEVDVFEVKGVDVAREVAGRKHVSWAGRGDGAEGSGWWGRIWGRVTQGK